MKDTIIINNKTVNCDNFGTSNYSFDLEAIIVNPKDISIEEIKLQEGVFLHPTQEPNSLEIFLLKGTTENYFKFYQSCADSFGSQCVLDKYGHWNTWKEEEAEERWELEDKMTELFKAWFE